MLLKKLKKKRKTKENLVLASLPSASVRLAEPNYSIGLIGTTCPNSLWLAGTFRSWVRSHLELKVPGDFQSR